MEVDQNAYTCLCPIGFNGQFCQFNEDNKNPCTENTCLNGGSCFFNTDQGITECFCQPGIEGKYCEINNKGQNCH